MLKNPRGLPVTHVRLYFCRLPGRSSENLAELNQLAVLLLPPGRTEWWSIERVLFPLVYQTMMMTSAQVVKTSFNVISNSHSQDCTHRDNHTLSTSFVTFHVTCYMVMQTKPVARCQLRNFLTPPPPQTKVDYLTDC